MRCFSRFARAAVLSAVALTVSAAVAPIDRTVVSRLKAMAFAHEFPELERSIETLRPGADAADPTWLEALSWAARGASFVKEWEKADAYANEAYEASTALVDSGSAVDSSPSLATALGASIEVLGQARDAAGDRSGAVAFLGEQRDRFRGTSIETRIQKNLLLISLEGKPMPKLSSGDGFVGPARPLNEIVEGKAALFFFWAHWCGDCERQRPVLARLHEELGERGLVVVGPTQLYGYIAGGVEADKAQELAYLRGAFQRSRPTPDWMTSPISAENFLNFGVSTTPTLVLVDREGEVRMYHPGRMPYEDLKAKIEAVL